MQVGSSCLQCSVARSPCPFTSNGVLNKRVIESGRELGYTQLDILVVLKNGFFLVSEDADHLRV